MLKPKSSQSSGCTYIHQASQKSLKNIAYQKANGNCFLGQDRSAVGDIHATRNNNRKQKVY
jgi:hypothetical protein